MERCHAVHMKQLLPGFLLALLLFLALAISPPTTAQQPYGLVGGQISNSYDTLIPHLPRHTGITQQDIADNENDGKHSPEPPLWLAYSTVVAPVVVGNALRYGYTSSTFKLRHRAIYLLTQRIRL